MVLLIFPVRNERDRSSPLIFLNRSGKGYKPDGLITSFRFVLSGKNIVGDIHGGNVKSELLKEFIYGHEKA